MKTIQALKADITCSQAAKLTKAELEFEPLCRSICTCVCTNWRVLHLKALEFLNLWSVSSARHWLVFYCEHSIADSGGQKLPSMLTSVLRQ